MNYIMNSTMPVSVSERTKVQAEGTKEGSDWKRKDGTGKETSKGTLKLAKFIFSNIKLFHITSIS